VYGVLDRADPAEADDAHDQQRDAHGQQYQVELVLHCASPPSAMICSILLWVSLSNGPSSSPAFEPSRMMTMRFEQRMTSSSSEEMNITETPSPHMLIISRWISETYGISTDICLVRAGMEAERLHTAALEMARQNAKEDIIRRVRERGDFPAMEELQKVLGLPTLPVRIEGFDIAHIGGKFPVASLISFYNGNPDKKNYREFRLKTTDGIIDDFASMKEATSRRYSRLLNEKKPLPDLILIDGGIGQVNAVDAVISSLGLDIPIAGLAKRDEEIWRPHASRPVCLPRRSDALRLLQRVRDETHRFATSRNQELRTKENTVSPFVRLPHVGRERDTLLMKTYGTLAALAAAPEADIARLLHVRAKDASEILLAARELLKKQDAQKARAALSLDLPGTTKEKAARYKLNADLAGLALGDEGGDSGLQEVASPLTEGEG
ncbi:MAG: hypothetical protein II932_00705, partial [Treponema sp.]|nr:hypothetical protein [Treponema sp.]